MAIFKDLKIKIHQQQVQKEKKLLQSNDRGTQIAAASQLIFLEDMTGYPLIIEELDAAGKYSYVGVMWLADKGLVDAIPHIDIFLHKIKNAYIAFWTLTRVSRFSNPDMIRVLLKFLERNPQEIESFIGQKPSAGNAFLPIQGDITGEDVMKQVANSLQEIVYKRMPDKYTNEAIEIFEEGLKNPNERVKNISKICLDTIKKEKEK